MERCNPSLQLQVAEFLTQQAKAGKWIIIETHSDLIIHNSQDHSRNLGRGDAIGQAKIGIYFSSIDNAVDRTAIQNALAIITSRKLAN